MKELLLLRHGRTEANDRHLYCGSTDLPLSPAGAEALRQLKSGMRYPDADGLLLFTSGMRRANETCRILFPDAAFTALPGFREMDFGAFEMRSYAELRYDPAYLAWISGDNESNLCPGGESGLLMKERVLAALEELTSLPAERAALVSHGGPVSAIMAHLFPKEHRTLYEWQPENGRGYLVTLGSGTPEYRSVPE